MEFLASGSALRTFSGLTSWVYSVAIAPDGLTALSASGTLTLWELASGNIIRTIQTDGSSVAIAPDGRTAVSGSRSNGSNGTLVHWDLASGRAIRKFDAGEVHSVAITPDGRTALSGGHGVSDYGALQLWDLT